MGVDKATWLFFGAVSSISLFVLGGCQPHPNYGQAARDYNNVRVEQPGAQFEGEIQTIPAPPPAARPETNAVLISTIRQQSYTFRTYRLCDQDHFVYITTNSWDGSVTMAISDKRCNE